MKKCHLLIILVLMGCKEISFPETQPRGKKALKEIPTKLRGQYLLTDDNGKGQDTLFVTNNGYWAGHNGKDKSLLSDSLVLKHYKEYYFLNILEKSRWLLRIVKLEKTGSLVLLSLDQEGNNFNDLLRRLSFEIRIDSTIVDDQKIYQIDPSPKQLMSLLKKGYFKRAEFKKIK